MLPFTVLDVDATTHATEQNKNLLKCHAIGDKSPITPLASSASRATQTDPQACPSTAHRQTPYELQSPKRNSKEEMKKKKKKASTPNSSAFLVPHCTSAFPIPLR
ncbi:hypothetical protein KC325_g70 [Hortaea werneckii]|nr:hypothetical protein KC325_g70 [Hortaea werneckii]